MRVAPFYPIGKKWLDNIKVSAYFHYVPTYTALIFSGDDNTTVCGGYISNWRYGLNLSIGRIGIGFEQQWGEGNLKKLDIGDDDDEDSGLNISSEKRKYRMATTRFYIGLKF